MFKASHWQGFQSVST